MRKKYEYLEIICPWTGETAQISPRNAALWTGRTLRTAQRWAAGATISRSDLALLRFYSMGVIDHPAWRRFRLRGDALECISTGDVWTPQQIEASWILFQQARDYRIMMQRQRAQVLRLHTGGRRWRRAL